MKLEDAQPYFRVGIPLFVLMTIPLTIWVAVTFRDPNIKAYSSAMADLNGDKKVNASDLQIFQASYLGGSSKADLNSDGQVDSGDFALFSKFYKPRN